MAKNYLTVEPDYTRLMQKHFNAGRGGNKIEFIVRHHAAGILTTDQMWQVWQSRQASAHYNIEVSGRVGQLVYDANTAWATGNTRGNQRGISIEHSNSGGQGQDWPIADATIDEGARWAAALCRYYKLGRPQYGRNIFDHRDFFATSCGYHLANGNRYHARWMRVAQDFYDHLTNPAPPAPTPKETEVTKEQADRIERKLDLLLDQVAGKRNDKGEQEFNGWPQGGHRTLYDAVCAVGAEAGIEGFADTKKGGK